MGMYFIIFVVFRDSLYLKVFLRVKLRQVIIQYGSWGMDPWGLSLNLQALYYEST